VSHDSDLTGLADLSGLILTVDVGTSSLKAVVYDGAGQVVASSTQRYGYRTPQAGWAEADPESWWQALEARWTSCERCLSTYGLWRL